MLGYYPISDFSQIDKWNSNHVAVKERYTDVSAVESFEILTKQNIGKELGIHHTLAIIQPNIHSPDSVPCFQDENKIVDSLMLKRVMIL
jgi:hypothetical protein